jgi:Flp pilus assembly protein TadD
MGHNNLGLALVQSGRLREATLAFGRAVELAPGDARLRLNLARALAQGARSEEALRELRIILSKDPGNSEAQALLDRLETRS